MTSSQHHESIFHDIRSPFQPSQNPKVEDVDALRRGFEIFQKLESNRDPKLSAFAPSALLMSSVKQLLDLSGKEELRTPPRKSEDANGSERNETNAGTIDEETTPRIVKRNASGGRAWLSKTTTRTNSRRKKRKYGNSARKLKHIDHFYENKSVKRTPPKIIEVPKKDDLAILSPVGISATQDQQEESEDFAFHSQSSILDAF